MKKDKVLSLVVALLMMVAAAIVVNKSVFGCSIVPSAATGVTEEAETVTASGEVVIHTADVPGCIDGYAGPVNLDIYISDGRIRQVKALDNVETPGFFKRAAVILSEWVGETPEDALLLKVDAVSGATYSSQAIITNVNSGLAYYEGTKARVASAMPWKLWVALIVTLCACIVPLVVRKKWYHTLQMVANVVVLGFWCGQFLDYAMIMKYISNGMALPAGLVAVAMLVAAFVYPLFGRPQHYCSHVCPLGSAQQIAAQVCGFKVHLSAKFVKGLDWFRRLLWAALMLLLWTDCLTGWMDLELFQAFQIESASWWIIGAAAAFVLLSTVVNRPYCRFVCPTGSLIKRAENIG
ncbi:MAG: FMN-binding protein [Paramuribaculum sp.]|nr:FMN-binding protein [Paramuribaculum sp.]